MNKRRIILSLIVGTMALSALSLSFSLAWYANTDRMRIDSLDMYINSEHNLYVSTKADMDSFKSSLNKADLNQVDEFIPVSSMYQHTWMDHKSDTPLFYDTSSPAVPSSGVPELKAVTNGFYQQKLYLMTDMIFDYYATLSGIDCSFEGNSEANLLRAQALRDEVPEMSEEEIQQKLDSLANSLRVSVLVPNKDYYSYTIIDPHKGENEVTYYAGRLDNSQNGYYDTYETLSGNGIIEKEVIYGEVNNRENISYDAPTSDTLGNVNFDTTQKRFFGNSFEAQSKATAYTYNQEQSLAAGVSFVEEPSLSLADLDNEETNTLLIPLHYAEPTEIIVSIYIEGWDLDCFNATMGASFTSTLSFKLLRRMN